MKEIVREGADRFAMGKLRMEYGSIAGSEASTISGDRVEVVFDFFFFFRSLSFMIIIR